MSAADPSDEVTLADIVAARQRILGGVERTACPYSPALSRLTGCEVFVKLEYQQRTGSFKERGARNALLQLPAAARTGGVVAASAGNHALALAWHARDLGIPVTVVMPRVAPLVKQARCRELGARVLIHGANIAEAKDLADELVAKEGLTYVHGFNDAAIIAGAGTVGLEVLEEVPDLDAVVVPVGGGGLIAGVGIAVKALRPEVRVIGVEPERAASFAEALRTGSPRRIAMQPTLADGLAVPEVGKRAFELARKTVDQVVGVGEEAISLAILRLVEMQHGVVEGAGASALAALFSDDLKHLAGKKVVLLLCGGNIDPLVLARVIEHSLAVDGRIVQFAATISDRPGGLADLAATIASTGASVQDIRHERIFGGPDVSRVRVACTVEVRDAAHADELQEALRARGVAVHERVRPAGEPRA
ncbi:MAG: threonine ammonia-lyase [Phycisphaera sp.]|nr:threonine ammonia-lyase [Phycisphaera sp.]